MKFLPQEFRELLHSIRRHGSARALFTLALALVGLAAVFTLLFHVLMLREGQEHSLLTGLYWTLTVMSTLGFGDVTFDGDLGRAFSMLVLLTGIAVLLFGIPTVFAEYIFKPWIENQNKHSAPRTLAEGIRDHVVICNYGEIAEGLIPRLETLGIEYVVLEADMARAAELQADGVRVVVGGRSALETFRAVRTDTARAVLANLGDAENTSIVLTVREVAPGTPVIALAEEYDAEDILKLAGATQVVPLKRRLAEQLARRVGEGMEVAHRIGRVGDLVIAEFPIHGTKLATRTLGDTHLHEHTGVSVVAIWERGVLLPAAEDTELSENSVLVLVGSEEQLTELDALFVIYHAHDAPVLVIGGGAVGRDVCAELRRREVPVTVLERDLARREELVKVADRVVIGDAAHNKTVVNAGVLEAPSVVLTTNDDATNIFLAVYCRKLHAATHIVSRITHADNRKPIHRAGADFALSYGMLAVQTLISAICQRELVVIGDAAELFIEPVPARFCGGTLGASDIARATGLHVIGMRESGNWLPSPPPETALTPGSELVMIGSTEQRRSFLALGGDD